MNAVAETLPTEMPDPIIFTESAAAKVADLIAEEGNPELKLRVFVQGGGCSGFQYGFTFDEITNEDDTVMTKNGVSLLIDAILRNDTPVIMAVTFVFSALVIAFNLVADILYGWLDPRIAFR